MMMGRMLTDTTLENLETTYLFPLLKTLDCRPAGECRLLFLGLNHAKLQLHDNNIE